MPDINLKKLTKTYNDVPVVSSISLDIKDGELLALVGHSGCGKTTILKLVAGLIYPEQGSIWIDGQDVTSVKAEKRDVVMVFQENLLFPHLSVGENIAFGLKMQGYDRKSRIKKSRELLGLMQLANLEKRYPSQLSSGQQQRIALARALALEPKVMLLDEPLSNLDPRLRNDLRELISQMHQTFNMTTVVVTHDQDEAMIMADRIAVMFDGKLRQVDTPYNIYNKPAARDVANLFGECNFLQGFFSKGKFYSDGHEFLAVDIKDSGQVEAFIRTEHVKAGAPKEDGITGVIIEKKYIGGQTLLKIALGELIISARGSNYYDFDKHSRVGVSIDWHKVVWQDLEETR